MCVYVDIYNAEDHKEIGCEFSTDRLLRLNPAVGHDHTHTHTYTHTHGPHTVRDIIDTQTHRER